MNKVILMGRLVRDIDLRTTQGGVSVAKFTLAVDKDMPREKRDAAKQAGKPTADFVSCAAFRQRADAMARFLHKGDPVLIEGSINTSTYTAQDGSKRYATEVWVTNFDFVGGSRQNAAQPAAAPAPAAPAAPQAYAPRPPVASGAPGAQAYAPAAPAAPQAPQAAPPASAQGYAVSDDDIPF